MSVVYLYVDFFTAIVPFLFTFHPKIKFYKTWKAFFPALFLTAFLFVCWDVYFSRSGIWGFNSQYLTGIQIAGLPIEEILFFICIPYACVFTFYCLYPYVANIINKKFENIVTHMLIAALTLASIIFYQRAYSAVTFISLALLLVVTKYVLRTEWLGKFYIVYTVLLVPFLIVNGILTGTGLDNPVVWYNEEEIIGIRILTIPVEDIFYGMELILANLLLFQYFYVKNSRKPIATRFFLNR